MIDTSAPADLSSHRGIREAIAGIRDQKANMKQHPPPPPKPPANDNRPINGARTNRGAANDNRPDDETPPPETPSLADLSSAFRNSVREFVEMIENALSAPVTDDPEIPPRFDERLQTELADSVEKCISEWDDRLSPEIAAKIADVLVYNAAAIVGRRILEHEMRHPLLPDEFNDKLGDAREGALGSGSSPRSGDALSDEQCAREFLQRAGRFAELFGDPETWNGMAAQRYAMDELARPLGLITGQSRAETDAVIELLRSLLGEMAARSWRDIVGIFLDVPAELPLPPTRFQSWQESIDREQLQRALERSVARDGLVRLVADTQGEVRAGVAGRRCMWLLMDDVAMIDVSDVTQALAYPDITPIDQWRPDQLTLPEPRTVVRLADELTDDGHTIEEIALAPASAPGQGQPGEAESLLVVGQLSSSWAVWSIPTWLLERIADEGSPLELHHDPDAMPADVRLYLFASKPQLVRGHGAEPLIAIRDHELRIFHLRCHSEINDSYGDCSYSVIDGIDHIDINAIYSMNPDNGNMASHVLMVSDDELYLYRSKEPGRGWWQTAELVGDAHVSLTPGASVFGVVGDLIIFQLPEELWAFLPIRALSDPDTPELADMIREASGLVLQTNDTAPDELAPLPPWVRIGQLGDLSVDDHGTFAVSFTDSAWTELYVRGDGLLPLYACALDGRHGGGKSNLCHIDLGEEHGKHGYLLFQSRKNQLEATPLAVDVSDAQVTHLAG